MAGKIMTQCLEPVPLENTALCRGGGLWSCVEEWLGPASEMSL